MFSCWLVPDLPGHVNVEEFPAVCLSLKLIEHMHIYKAPSEVRALYKLKVEKED